MAKFVAVNWRDLRNPEAGGAEVHLHQILKSLAANGHDVTLFSTVFPGAAPEEEYDGIRVIRRGRWYTANFTLPFHVRSYLRRHPCDLVIEDINKIPFFLPLFTRVRVVPVIPHLFGATVFRETNAILALYVLFWELFIPLVYRKCRFAVISPSTQDDLVRRGIARNRVDVVLCGLDHATYRLIDGVERYHAPTIVHFGRMRKYKSIDVVIRAFELIRRELNDAQLLIIGGGPERANLERFVSKMRLNGAVKFLGTMKTEDMVRELNRSHLFLNASPKEGWGLTVVEANACGVPVVASRRPGLRDSVIDGKTGYLVEYGDHRAFAERSLELLRDPVKWQGMSESAVEWARSLTWERTAQDMQKFFLDVIAGRGDR